MPKPFDDLPAERGAEQIARFPMDDFEGCLLKAAARFALRLGFPDNVEVGLGFYSKHQHLDSSALLHPHERHHLGRLEVHRSGNPISSRQTGESFLLP